MIDEMFIDLPFVTSKYVDTASKTCGKEFLLPVDALRKANPLVGLQVQSIAPGIRDYLLTIYLPTADAYPARSGFIPGSMTTDPSRLVPACLYALHLEGATVKPKDGRFAWSPLSGITQGANQIQIVDDQGSTMEVCGRKYLLRITPYLETTFPVKDDDIIVDTEVGVIRVFMLACDRA